MKKLMLAFLVAGVVAAGCAAPGTAVQLLTGSAMPDNGCFTNFALGKLIVDPKYGTAVIDETSGGATAPVMWRSGFTGLQVGSDVEVRDPAGKVVATTGHRYQISGGYVEDPRAFFACAEVIPQ